MCQPRISHLPLSVPQRPHWVSIYCLKRPSGISRGRTYLKDHCGVQNSRPWTQTAPQFLANYSLPRADQVARFSQVRESIPSITTLARTTRTPQQTSRTTMLRRSQTANKSLLLPHTLDSRRHRSLTARPCLRNELLNASEAEQGERIADTFQTHHGYEARTPQVTSVVNLVHGRPTFLLAGTGFGKSRVPEMFYHAHDLEAYAPIVMTINPLDSLGDDQVGEKASVELNAINLTADNCTKEACDAIIEGKHPFVYVSPEIALTSPVFDRLWRDPRFQARLILIVVDEAHMVYSWGLVESGQAKRLVSHTRVHDGGAFRPSYGDLARRFLSCVKVPIVLMSATCTPQAIQAIIDNLKLNARDVRFVRGELVRPELRLIRRTFKRPLKASIRTVFAHHTVVPTASIPPNLLYSGTQNGTLDFLQLVNNTRGTPNDAADGFSEFARRYHATTGDTAKLSAVEAFVAGTLAVLCCTLALGLGQNWHRVRRVVVVGRQDPCNFIQMAGRCGRDGRRGLGILLVENKRTNGKNSISDFKNPTRQSDDDRMDALAITPVCLRVALAVDLSEGYIPLYGSDPAVTCEIERQRGENMPDCDCSNCLPYEAEALWLAQRALSNDNYDAAMAMGEDDLVALLEGLTKPPEPPVVVSRPVALVCGADDAILESTLLECLVTRWDLAFSRFFFEIFPEDSDVGPRDYFGRDLAWDLAKNVDIFHKASDMSVVLASEVIPGQFECLYLVFAKWKAEFNTDTVLAQAAEERLHYARGHSNPKVPQSLEGLEINKRRAEAAKEATRLARIFAKEQKILATAAKKKARLDSQARKAQQKADTKRLRLARQGASGSARPRPTRPAPVKAQRVVSGGSKRAAEGELEALESGKRGHFQDPPLPPPDPQPSPHLPMQTTHFQNPIETAMTDLRLCHLGST